MGSSRFFSALAALLFLALSCWLGAYLCGRASTPATVELYDMTVTRSAEIRGVAVRSERQLDLERGESVTAGDFERLPAGGTLAVLADGSRLCVDGPAIYLEDSDGCEGLCPERLTGLTVSELAALLDEPPGSAGDGRLVTAWVWYFAALFEGGEELSPGPCRVLFEGFTQPEQARLLSVSAPERGRRALILRLTSGDRESLSLRRCTARLLLEEYSGLRAPRSAVQTLEDGSNFVCKLTVGGFERLAVDIIYREDDYVLIRGDGLTAGCRVRVGRGDK